MKTNALRASLAISLICGTATGAAAHARDRALPQRAVISGLVLVFRGHAEPVDGVAFEIEFD